MAAAAMSVQWTVTGTRSERLPKGTSEGWRAGEMGRGLDSEERLVERCLRGDATAWEGMVRTYARRVYPICLRFTGNDTDAQDLTQEVFLRVYKSLQTFKPTEGAFGVWLTRLTRNLLIDHYRRAKMDRATDSMEDQQFQVERQSPSTMSADAVLAHREARDLLQEGLNKLSPELREAVILRDLEQMEYKEIPDELNIPATTAKSRLKSRHPELERKLRKKVRE